MPFFFEMDFGAQAISLTRRNDKYEINSLKNAVVHIKITLCGHAPGEVHIHDFMDKAIPLSCVAPKLSRRADPIQKFGRRITGKGKPVAHQLTVLLPIALDGIIQSAGLSDYGNRAISGGDHL